MMTNSMEFIINTITPYKYIIIRHKIIFFQSNNNVITY